MKVGISKAAKEIGVTAKTLHHVLLQSSQYLFPFIQCKSHRFWKQVSPTDASNFLNQWRF